MSLQQWIRWHHNKRQINQRGQKYHIKPFFKHKNLSSEFDYTNSIPQQSDFKQIPNIVMPDSVPVSPRPSCHPELVSGPRPFFVIPNSFRNPIACISQDPDIRQDDRKVQSEKGVSLSC